MEQALYQRLRTELEERKAAGNYRELPLVSFCNDRIMLDANSYVDLSSNDYLGIAREPKYINTFLQTMLDTERSGSDFAGHFLMSSISAGATGSRLLTGNHMAYSYIEELISSLYNGSLSCAINQEQEDSNIAACTRRAQAHSRNLSAGAGVDESKPESMGPTGTGICACGCCSDSLGFNFSDLELKPDCPESRDGTHSGAEAWEGSWSRTDATVDAGAGTGAGAHGQAWGHNHGPDYGWGGSREHAQNKQASLLKISEERECLYINSGFEANEGVLSTIFGKKDLLLIDKLCHASIIDGMLKSPARSLRYRHNDMDHLKALLDAHASSYDNVCIVTESVFSMDGDLAPLREIAALKKRYDNVLLYVDEAHSFGLYAEDGLGLCKELGILDAVDFLMGTLSKAIGSYGAFLLCRREVKEYLINFMRPFIYSTALPAVNISFSMYIIGLLQTPLLQSKREYLHMISAYLHSNLCDLGINPSQSQIQPLVTGDNDKARHACRLFKQAGLLAMPIRYPTVPQHQARLRLSLNSTVSIDDIDLITRLVSRYRHLFV